MKSLEETPQLILGGIFLLVVLGMGFAGCYDEVWTYFLKTHVHNEFTTFMGRTVFEGERVGGSDLATFFQIACLVFYLASLKAPFQSTLYRWRPYLGFLICVVFMANLFPVHGLKWAMGRARPFAVFQSDLPFTAWYEFGPHFINQGIYRGSFPSGHTASVMTLLGGVFVLAEGYGLRPRQRLLLVILVILAGLLMAIGRAMLGSHWISDGLFSVGMTGMLTCLLYYWVLRVPGQLNHLRAQEALPDLPNAWELGLCVNIMGVCVGAVLTVFGVRALQLGPLWLTFLIPLGLVLATFSGKRACQGHADFISALKNNS